ncbi:MAG TPA: c-type cytochrome [Vicinamibacterales bacterium]|nr:c-type cytochrome [Vicinamibacterales bacterium]
MQSSYAIAGAALLLISVGLTAPLGSPTATAAQTSKQAPASAPSLQVAGITGNLEHGRYLVEDVAQCVQCHSPRDAQGNIIESREFYGAPIPFNPPWPNDWAIRAPRNRGLPGYDDAQAMRLLTEGAIGRDGQQLKPPMPRFHMTKQDAADVIVFMRSLQ